MTADESQAQRRELIRQFGPYLLIAVAIVSLFFAYRIPPTVQGGRPIDAFTYTGYVHNFEELVRLHGFTYHSVRFGLILPAWLMAKAFGPVAGFYVLRFLLTFVSLSLYFRCVRRSLGATMAAAGVVMLLATPAWYHAVLWDYVDATAVPYLLCGTSLLLFPQERWVALRAIVVGAFFSQAVDSNVWSLPLAAFACVGGLVFQAERWKRYVAFDVPLMALGGLLAHGSGLLFYYWKFGFWRLDEITYETATRLGGGGYQSFGRADLSWITEVLQIYLVPFFLLTMLIARKTRFCRFSRATWVFGFLAGGFYFYWEFLHPYGVDVLYLPYYRSYLLPGWALLFPCALKQLCERLPERVNLVITAAMAGLTLILPFWSEELSLRFIGAAPLALASAVLFVGLRFAGARTVVRAAFISIWWLLILVQHSAYLRTNPTTRLLYYEDSPDNLDLYRMAVEFPRIVPPAQSESEFRFWLSGNDLFVLQMQATYAMGRSMLGSWPVPERTQGMPILDEKARSALRNPQLQRVILLASQPREIQAGTLALSNEIPGATLASRDQLVFGRWKLEAAVVELPRQRPPIMIGNQSRH